MLLLTFTIRHMLRHFGMNIAVLFCLSLGAGLLASLPSFASLTAEKALAASLENAHPSVRNIKVAGPTSILNSALNSFINETIGSLVAERITVNNIQREVHPSEPLIKSGQVFSIDLEGLWLWSFDKLNQHANLLQGDWPSMTSPRSQIEALRPPTIQAAISGETASILQISPGDLLQDRSEFKYLVTGVFQINDPAEDVWWQDSSPITITVEPGLNEDTLTAPIFIHPQAMKAYFRGYASEWRYILTTGQINSTNVNEVEESLINLKNTLTANRVSLTSGLPDLVQEFKEDLSSSRMILFLLSGQAMLFVIFTLILMANYLVASSQNEISTMTSRGASRFQILMAYALQVFILAIFAASIFGPLFSWTGLQIWGLISSETVITSLTSEAWLMSWLAAVVGWLAVVIAIIPATRAEVIDWQKSTSRPELASGWQKKYLDIFLFIIGIILFWQLSSSGTFVMRRIQGSDFADPFLLLGPSLLLIAIAMLYLRLFPLILRALTNLTKSGRGILLPISLTRIARNPQGTGWIVLLISLASGLILFTKVYSDALHVTQQQIAVYQAGSDLRLDGNQVPDSYIEEIIEVLPVSRVQRGVAQDKSGRGIVILAVEPDTFARVSEYPDGMTNLSIDIIMNAIKQPSQQIQNDNTAAVGNPYTEIKEPSHAVPAIFSYAALPKGAEIGDHHEFLLAGQAVNFEVRGIISDFPTVSANFLIINTQLFDDAVGRLNSAQLRNREYWIRTDAQTHKQLVSYPTIRNAILGDSHKMFNIIRNHVMTLGTVRAFGLNGLILAIISLVGLLLANYFSFHQRKYEFGILRAYGLSLNQSNLLLVSEGILVLGLGLMSGVFLGYSLTELMRPYISSFVSRTLPGMVVHQIQFNWLTAAAIIGLLLVMYCIAMAVIIIALRKSNVQEILRTGDE